MSNQTRTHHRGHRGASRLTRLCRSRWNKHRPKYQCDSLGQRTKGVKHFADSAARMTTTKQFDYLNRLKQITSTPGASGTLPFSYNYNYNSANQRTKNTLADGSYWEYEYDTLGQVTNGVKHFADGTLVPGQQFGYLFDDIGNRKLTTAGGDSNGQNLRLANFTNNYLNQITIREVPGTNDVIGAARATNAVTVNGQTAWRKGEYFWATVQADNAASAQWLDVVVASSGKTNAGSLYLPKTQEIYSYDGDGNRISDGRFNYQWDAESRITHFERVPSAPAAARGKVECQYDYRSRRTQKIVSAWNASDSSYVAQSTNRYIYDGWNLVAILDATNGLDRSFTWGTDLSGTMQGAGGVGGLISMTLHHGTNAGTYFYCYDGNCNVMGLVNAANGEIAARYEYDPFLAILRATGPLAYLNPFLGSTKFYDWETGFYYYGYRYYDPLTGTWPSRDPICEHGGKNLYRFGRNNSVNNIDRLGLFVTADSTQSQILAQPQYCAAWVSAVDNWISQGSDLSGRYTAWYESRFPNTTSYVKENFRKTIDNLVSTKMCRGDKLLDNELPTIGVNGYGTGERTKVGNTTEQSFGDQAQSSTEAALSLGNYNIKIKSIETCFSKCSIAGCSKSYSWTARIILVDGLGINPTNVGASEEDPDVWKWWEFYVLEQNVFGPERSVVVASWTLAGKGCCKK